MACEEFKNAEIGSAWNLENGSTAFVTGPAKDGVVFGFYCDIYATGLSLAKGIVFMLDGSQIPSSYPQATGLAEIQPWMEPIQKKILENATKPKETPVCEPKGKHKYSGIRDGPQDAASDGSQGAVPGLRPRIS